ncbi:aquaporin [Rhodococcus jostii]|uniref:Aquaporin Z n=1 Tax=Rhodococcus jostii TaxID=132919 RepID=A0A1H4IQW1_RHOJO|nr:aquaporin [Rhodococcus jostii]SEB36439.1 aquaporin Z [Rhodococcus jostii]
MVPSPDAVEVVTREQATALLTRRPGMKYAVESIRTFLLVFTVGAAALGGGPVAPLALGAVLMVMIYARAHHCCGHYNPAMTMVTLVRGRIGPRTAAEYCVVQLGAGLLAAAAVRGFVDPAHAGTVAAVTPPGHTPATVWVVEQLFTFALCCLVLNVATRRSPPDNSLYGLMIGFTVVAGAFAVGTISGGGFNPAVVLSTGAGTAAGFALLALAPGDT